MYILFIMRCINYKLFLNIRIKLLIKVQKKKKKKKKKIIKNKFFFIFLKI